MMNAISRSNTPLFLHIGARKTRQKSRRWRIGALFAITALLFLLSLMIGQRFVNPAEILQIGMGQNVDGANFVVEKLRFPRSLLSLAVGLSFGAAGAAFQTMLRNPLASPDIIGINAGASAAAVFAIVVLSATGMTISILAIIFSLLIAALIYALAFKDGVTGARIILIGVGVAAMLDSAIAFLLKRAMVWDMQEALRWLTGSVNGAKLEYVFPVFGALIVFGGALYSQAQKLELLRLGDDAASSLGISVQQTKLIVTLSAVALIAVATAAAGPISFVAFLSGPIAARIIGQNGSILLPAAFVGAVLVLGADLVGQHGLPHRYPVGVITGAIGAPFLIYLTIQSTRNGESI